MLVEIFLILRMQQPNASRWHFAEFVVVYTKMIHTPIGQLIGIVELRKKLKMKKKNVDFAGKREWMFYLPCTAREVWGSFLQPRCRRSVTVDRGPRSLCSPRDWRAAGGIVCSLIPTGSDNEPKILPAPRRCISSTTTCETCTHVRQGKLSENVTEN